MPCRRRSGFTLLETLVVIVIIAVLTAISWMAFHGAMGHSKEKATLADMVKLNDLLRRRVDQFVFLQRKQPGDIDRRSNQLYSQREGSNAGGIYWDLIPFAPIANAGFEQKCRKIAREHALKEAFRDAFPQRWDECPDGAAPSIINVETESAECLYYFLFVAECGGLTPTGNGEINDSVKLADTDGNGRFEIVDHWGRPVQFYRWPTRLVRPNGIQDDPTAEHLQAIGLSYQVDRIDLDPDDLSGVDLWATWRAVRDNNFPGETEDNWHTPECWHAPLVVSAGFDGVTGLELPNRGEPYGSTNNRNGLARVIDAAALFDNVTTWSVRR
jgi:prepilin-type N-terminal cleavage/methylation domain-containing protein